MPAVQQAPDAPGARATPDSSRGGPLRPAARHRLGRHAHGRRLNGHRGDRDEQPHRPCHDRARAARQHPDESAGEGDEPDGPGLVEPRPPVRRKRPDGRPPAGRPGPGIPGTGPPPPHRGGASARPVRAARPGRWRWARRPAGCPRRGPARCPSAGRARPARRGRDRGGPAAIGTAVSHHDRSGVSLRPAVRAAVASISRRKAARARSERITQVITTETAAGCTAARGPAGAICRHGGGPVSGPRW